MTVTQEPLVGIVLVNFNGWQDTIECLESLLKLNYLNYRIVITDNNSQDNSVHFIKEWANGNLDCNFNQSTISRKIAFPPANKPVKLRVLSETDAKQNPSDYMGEVVLIKSTTNRGFAGGNNVATDFLNSSPSKPSYIWYLNNDTVIDRNALRALTSHFSASYKKGLKTGILGSKLRYYHKPDTIQAIGASFNPWLASAKHVGCNELDRGQYDTSPENLKLDYVVGASMLVSNEFIKEVGLMCPDYFLYFEEIDWVERGKRKGFTISYCPTSIVYHKEGAAIGTNAEKKIKSELSDYYDLRNRIKFTRKNYFWRLPIVYASMAGVIVNRIRRGQFARVGMIFRIISGKALP